MKVFEGILYQNFFLQVLTFIQSYFNISINCRLVNLPLTTQRQSFFVCQLAQSLVKKGQRALNGLVSEKNYIQYNTLTGGG